ncbi:hypothetical protein Tco_0841333 [Tanacetum coccineum]|uniref:Uncharacterized protein n=1 Tax=Tanacetum coccineum TaxID=301880 RepID=A0ABQ5B0D3_9ASTR
MFSCVQETWQPRGRAHEVKLQVQLPPVTDTHNTTSRSPCPIQAMSTKLSIASVGSTCYDLKWAISILRNRVRRNERARRDKSKKKQRQDVPIVKNFPKYFPRDLPGLPIYQTMNFTIDLVPGAAPVSTGHLID